MLVEKWRLAAIFSARVLVSLFTVPSFSASARSLSLSLLFLTSLSFSWSLCLLSFSLLLYLLSSLIFFSLPPSPIYILSLPPFLLICPPQPLTYAHISLSSDGMRSADAVG